MKSAPKVRQTTAGKDQKARAKRLPKSHVDYWKARVKKRAQGANYSAQLQHRKHREWFNLDTANKDEAARKAKTIHAFLVSNGWEKTIQEFKKPAEKPAAVETVGQLIEAARERAQVKPRTLEQYCVALRMIAAGVKGIKSDDKSRFGGSETLWHRKVNRVKLSAITAEKVTKWAKRRTEGLSPDKAKSRQRSTNSMINQARSLWKYAPQPSPFAGFKWKPTSKRFEPTVGASTLLHYAAEELKGDEPELYKALVLCLFLGLRKAEADTLTWSQVDFARSVVKIETTEFFSPKSEDAEREIPVADSTLKELSSWRADSGKVFLLNGRAPKRELVSYDYYRAEKTWDALTAWLRSKGVEANMPIHYLRKLSGSLMYRSQDIYAAQRFLGHSNFKTTAGSYLDGELRPLEIEAEKPELRVAK